MFWKKKKSDEEMDSAVITTDIKEPFSLHTFIDEKIIERWKTFKKFLDEKGILFFIQSPFQYRNRLIAKMVLLVICILAGIIPRAFTVLEETKARNASSEFSQIKDKTFSVGKLTIKPLASSHVNKTHVLAFELAGSTKDGIPTLASEYDIDLAPLRGVADADKVTYKYTTVPVNVDSRLLIIYVNNTQQNDFTGVYGLKIAHKKAEQRERLLIPMEVILSDTQEQTPLYDGQSIHLSTLSNKIHTKTNTIEKAKFELEKALEVYKVNEDRLLQSQIKISMTTDKLTKFIDDNLILKQITDESTTDDVEKDAKAPTFEKQTISIMIDGKEYSDKEGIKYEPTTTEGIELPTLANTMQTVYSKASALNDARLTKNRELLALVRTLSKELYIDEMIDRGSIGSEPLN